MDEATELIEPGHTRRNLRDLETKLRKGFAISDAMLQAAPLVMAGLLRNGSNREKIAAARVMVAMHNSNNPQVQAHLHQHVSQPAGPDESMAGADLEDIKADNLRRIASSERCGVNC